MAPPIDLPLLNLQDNLQTRLENGRQQIYDPIRRKWLALAPEELVRQLLLLYLVREKRCSPNRIGVEKKLTVNDMTRRCDILVYAPDMQPWMLVECKAPSVAISQAVFDQAARYNLPLRVPYLAVSNGRDTYCCSMDYEQEGYTFLKEIPEFPQNKG